MPDGGTTTKIEGLSPRDIADFLALRKIWSENPLLYVRQRLGMEPSWQQAQLFEAVRPPGAKVAVRSGHGTGKSTALAGTGWWALETQTYPKIPCTAPTRHQLETVLWAELAKWLRASDEQSRKLGLPKALWLSTLFDMSATMIRDRGNPREWFAVARTSTKDRPEALQGFHASNLVSHDGGRTYVQKSDDKSSVTFLIEEASGVYDAIFQVAEGALSSPDCRLIMMANPTRTDGYFFDAFHKQASSYTAKLHWKGSDSPFVSPDYRAKMSKKWGASSNVVRVRCDGEFPSVQSNVLIPLANSEAAVARGNDPRVLAQARAMRGGIIGVDVARYGDDRTTIIHRLGNVASWASISTKEGTMETVGRIVMAIKLLKPIRVCVDEIGIGAGVVDRLKELKRSGVITCEIVAVQVSARAEPKDGDESYQAHLVRDQLWLDCERHLREDEPVFAFEDREMAEDLAAELSSARYIIQSDGSILMESKDDMKKADRVGRSPDLGDGYNATFATPARGGREPITSRSSMGL